MSRSKFTVEQVAEARELRAAGNTWDQMGWHFGCSGETVRRALDPAWAERRRQMIQSNRVYPNARREGVREEVHRATHETMRADALARMAEIPDDTRSLTARILGDPIPGDTRRQRYPAHA